MTQRRLQYQLMSTHTLMTAYQDSIKWARSLKIGDRFHGAAIAGEAKGFKRGTAGNHLFISGALDTLVAVRTDTDGTLTHIEVLVPKDQPNENQAV